MSIEVVIALAITAALFFALGWVVKGVSCAGDDGEAFAHGFREGVLSRGGKVPDIEDLRAGRDA